MFSLAGRIRVRANGRDLGWGSIQSRFVLQRDGQSPTGESVARRVLLSTERDGQMADDKPNGHTEEHRANGHAEEQSAKMPFISEDDWYLPDDEAWRPEPDYNPDVAEPLRQAHKHLAGGGGLSAYLAAFNGIAGILDVTMSRRQRLAALFIAALALAADDPPTRALEAIDEALEIALELGIERAQEDLLLLRASVNRAILQIPDAAEDLEFCLNVIAARSETGELSPTELDTRLEAVLHLANSMFLTGQYDRAEQLLNRAAALIPRVPTNPKAPLYSAWMRALLLRWRGEYELALTYAMEAADGYALLGPSGMASRIRGIVGEVALDLAERCRNNHQPLACDAFLTLADTYIVSAIELAADDDQGATETMASITQCRFLLLKGEGESEGRIAWLEELSQRGAEHQDSAIVAQAYTQLGREYEAQGDFEAARHWYQRALAALKESQMVALGIWAQRALWRLGGEMGPDDGP